MVIVHEINLRSVRTQNDPMTRNIFKFKILNRYYKNKYFQACPNYWAWWVFCDYWGPLQANSDEFWLDIFQDNSTFQLIIVFIAAIFASTEGRGFDAVEFSRRYGSQSVLCRKTRSVENITEAEVNVSTFCFVNF